MNFQLDPGRLYVRWPLDATISPETKHQRVSSNDGSWLDPPRSFYVVGELDLDSGHGKM